MYTNIHTIEWNFDETVSTDKIKYFKNRITGEWLAESTCALGVEYYICSDAQVHFKQVGNYIGCITEKDVKTYMVYDHEREAERNISLNDEVYLK